MKPTRKFVVRPHRYPVNDNYVVRVTIHQEGNDEPLTVNAQLLDISPGGAKLSLTSPIRFQEALTLSLHSDELDLHLSVSARVCWIRQQGPEAWVLGCAFEPELPDAELERLFAYGLLERRQTPRQSVRGQATARWELHPDETTVGLLDLSTGGFSVLSPFAAQIGSRLQMAIEPAMGTERINILANVQWQLQVDGGFVFGCGFSNNQTYSALKACLHPPEPACAMAATSRLTMPLLCLGVIFSMLLWCWYRLGLG